MLLPSLSNQDILACLKELVDPEIVILYKKTTYLFVWTLGDFLFASPEQSDVVPSSHPCPVPPHRRRRYLSSHLRIRRVNVSLLVICGRVYTCSGSNGEGGSGAMFLSHLLMMDAARGNLLRGAHMAVVRRSVHPPLSRDTTPPVIWSSGRLTRSLRVQSNSGPSLQIGRVLFGGPLETD